jgi:hypothetical protein
MLTLRAALRRASFAPRYRKNNYYKMIHIDVSPPVNRWMRESLDRDAFRKTVPVLAARVPASKAGLLLKAPETKK